MIAVYSNVATMWFGLLHVVAIIRESQSISVCVHVCVHVCVCIHVVDHEKDYVYICIS